jgi:DNA-binding winged helix-turn-helix (wHTH) protein
VAETELRFGPFTLNSATRELTGAAGALHLSTKAFDLLAILAQERPTVLTKADLQQRLWPDTFVAETNLANLIAEIRQALDDPSRTPRYIRTVHRIGYAFCGAAAAGRSLQPTLCWIEWGTEHFPLHAGEHVIGRDPDVSIRIDAATVSRRHARILVTPDRVVLEDFGSKNGTFRAGARIDAPTPLADGDHIRIGSQLVTFHARLADSTATHVEPAG